MVDWNLSLNKVIGEDSGENAFEEECFEGVMIDQGEVYVAEGNLMVNGFACDYKVNDDFFRGVGIGGYVLVE